MGVQTIACLRLLKIADRVARKSRGQHLRELGAGDGTRTHDNRRVLAGAQRYPIAKGAPAWSDRTAAARSASWSTARATAARTTSGAAARSSDRPSRPSRLELGLRRHADVWDGGATIHGAV